MRTLLALLLMAGTAHAELLAEFSWDNPKPVTSPREYVLYSSAVHHAGSGRPWLPDYVPDWAETGGHWPSPGDATLSDSQALSLFEEWWTRKDDPAYHNIYLGVDDNILGWQSSPGSRDGIPLDLVLDGLFNGYVGWFGDRHVPKLGPVMFGYDITHLERIVTPTNHRIEIYGSPLAVPEPGTLFVMLGTATCTFMRRRRGIK